MEKISLVDRVKTESAIARRHHKLRLRDFEKMQKAEAAGRRASHKPALLQKTKGRDRLLKLLILI